jgi:hypothetical protein
MVKKFFSKRLFLNNPILGSIVQCSARAVTKNGQAGFESTSEIVTAVSMDTQCPYSKGRANTVNIDPYQANISNMSTQKIIHKKTQ